jgi:hypothetical protein
VNEANDPWLHCHRWSLHLGDADTFSHWSYELGDSGDLRLCVHERSPEGERRGELLIVGGRALAIHELDGVVEGRELEEVDAPGLVLQLTRDVLRRLLPAGPAAVTEPLRVEREELQEAISVGTLSGSGQMMAPWHAAATLRRADGDVVVFELLFRHGIGTADQGELRVSGRCAPSAPRLVLDNAMSLEGWRLFLLGPRHGQQMVDFGSHGAAQVGTIAELRRQSIGA